MNRTLHRPPSMPIRVWAWLVVAVLLVQAAVPLLAATAASHQGVSLVEICSIYGVRTLHVDTDGVAADTDHAPTPAAQHAGGFECSLTSVLAGAVVPVALPAVLRHAPRQHLANLPASVPAVPVDATQRWLAARLHAPPRSV